MRSVVDRWWVRILLMMATLGGMSLAGAVVTSAVDPLTIQSIAYGAAILVMVAIEKARTGGSPIASGIVPTPMTPRMAIVGAGAAIVGLAMVGGVSLIIGGTFVPEDDAISTHVISTMVLLALGEEVVFRGTIFTALEERFGAASAVLFTSLPFALVHAFNPGASIMSIINVGLAGIALGTAVAVTGSLWTSIGFHIVWNIGTALVFGPVSGIDMSIGIVHLDAEAMPESLVQLVTGPFGIEDGAVTTIVLIVATVLVVRWQRFDPFVRAARFRRSFAHPR